MEAPPTSAELQPTWSSRSARSRAKSSTVYGPAGLSDCTVAAAIVDQDRHAACEPLDHRLPEPPIHGEGMDKHDAVRTLAVQGIGEARPVAGCRHGGRHRSRACFQVWRTLWHANERTPAVRRPRGRKGARRRTARAIVAHRSDDVKNMRRGRCWVYRRKNQRRELNRASFRPSVARRKVLLYRKIKPSSGNGWPIHALNARSKHDHGELKAERGITPCGSRSSHSRPALPSVSALRRS